MLKLKFQYFGHLMEELPHLKRPWCWPRLKAGGEGDDRGWAGWMALATRWTWVWVSSRSWWWTRKPGVLQSMGLQRVGHDWMTELTVTYKLWEYYLDSRALGFLICEMEMMIARISKYFGKTWKMWTCQNIWNPEDALFLIFLYCAKRTWRNKIGFMEAEGALGTWDRELLT